MLFLLSLAAIIVSTGILDKHRKRRKKEEERFEYLANMYGKGRVKIGGTKKPTPIKPKPYKPTLQSALRLLENLSESQWRVLRRNYHRLIKTHGGTFSQEFEKFLSSLNYALRRKMNNTPISHNQERLINIAKKLFIDSKTANNFRPIWSSWLINASYNPVTHIMLVSMKRGRMLYPFFNVTDEAYILLVSTKSHAGTLWWRRNYWRFSTNYHKWIGKGRKR